MAWRTASRMVSSPYHSGGSQPAPTGSASDTPEYSSGVSIDGIRRGLHGGRQQRGRQVLARHKIAGTAARGQQPQRHQPVVGLHNCKGADAITLGKLPHRRHLGAHAQLPARHHAADRGDDLLDQAALLPALDGDAGPTSFFHPQLQNCSVFVACTVGQFDEMCICAIVVLLSIIASSFCQLVNFFTVRQKNPKAVVS
jgi:hypothetical protein